MNTHRALHAPLSQQALSLGLAVLVTAGLMGSVLGIAADDQQALMASQAGQAEKSAEQAIDHTAVPQQAKATALHTRRG